MTVADRPKKSDTDAACEAAWPARPAGDFRQPAGGYRRCKLARNLCRNKPLLSHRLTEYRSCEVIFICWWRWPQPAWRPRRLRLREAAAKVARKDRAMRLRLRALKHLHDNRPPLRRRRHQHHRPELQPRRLNPRSRHLLSRPRQRRPRSRRCDHRIRPHRLRTLRRRQIRRIPQPPPAAEFRRRREAWARLVINRIAPRCVGSRNPNANGAIPSGMICPRA